MNNGAPHAFPPGVELLKLLRGHTDVVLRLSWSPDGRTLASTSVDRTIRLWDWETGETEKVLVGHYQGVNQVAWGPARAWLASASFDHSIRIWNLGTGETIRELWDHTDDVSGIAVSPDGNRLASASADRSIRLWETHTWAPSGLMQDHASGVYRVAWSPDGEFLASCSKDRTIRVRDLMAFRPAAPNRSFNSQFSDGPGSVDWAHRSNLLAASMKNGIIYIQHVDKRRPRSLDGHTDLVRSAVFSSDDRLLASSSLDGTVRLWRTDTWELVAQIDEPTSPYWPQGIAFHPAEPILATFGEQDRVIRLWRLDVNKLLGLPAPVEQVTYRNAKVVLLGDTGVGKTGLRLVLTGEPFDQEMRLPSTFGRRVFAFESVELEEDGRKEHREILLWDMAGQPAYRLVHQLHLGEVTTALAVFDARQAVGDPLSAVRHWARALRQAQQRESGAAPPLKALLVWARADIQGPSISVERIQAFQREWNFDEFFVTSAADGRGIPQLADAIRRSIDWDALPVVSSPKLFEKLKTFLIANKSAGQIIATAADLFRSFQASHAEDAQTPNLRAIFDTCVSRLENRDLIRRLSFGGLILLQPELLDVYASAMVVASAESGALAEEDVLAGRFVMPGSERLTERDQEKWLLIATVEEMLWRQLVLRERSSEGTYLVFPSQFNRDWPDAPDPKGKQVMVRFEGPVQNIYATLAVRLGHLGMFQTSRDAMWRNAVIFEADTGGECGLYLREFDDGAGEFTLFFRGEPSPTPETRFRFEAFVLSHLKSNAVADTVVVQRLFSCPRGHSIPQEFVDLRRATGFDWFDCPCGARVSLAEPKERIAATREAVQGMEAEVERERNRGTSKMAIRGKEEIDEYDVFLCHNSKDKEAVLTIATRLEERKVRSWVDVVDLRPGDVWMNAIEDVIRKVKCAVVFLGPSQLGPFEQIEMRALVRQFVDGGVRVIPAILPGAQGEPDWQVFLNDFHRVDFRTPRPDPFSELLYGITGVRPEPG